MGYVFAMQSALLGIRYAIRDAQIFSTIPHIVEGATLNADSGFCVEGHCKIPCDSPLDCSGTDCCGGWCTDTGFDNNNCGHCSVSCESGLGCCHGTCMGSQLKSASPSCRLWELADSFTDGTRSAMGYVRQSQKMETAELSTTIIVPFAERPVPAEWTAVTPSVRIFRAILLLAEHVELHAEADTVATVIAHVKSCGGTCIDPQTDPNNCGDCGIACSVGQGCCYGTCVGQEAQRIPTVPIVGIGGFIYNWYAFCDGTCRPLAEDGNGFLVRFGELPDFAVHVPSGFQCCGGACFDTHNDPRACGNCNSYVQVQSCALMVIVHR